jgi:hypothetical protein
VDEQARLVNSLHKSTTITSWLDKHGGVARHDPTLVKKLRGSDS